MQREVFLDKNAVVVAPSSTEKFGLLREMSDTRAADGQLKDPHKALSDLVSREKAKGTGLEHGVAVPHCRPAGSEQLTASFALVPEGIDFDAPDSAPSRFVFLLVSPTDATAPHVQALATMARLLTQEKVQADLLGAKDPESVARILIEAKT